MAISSILLTSDLMLSSQAQGAALRAARTLEIDSTPAQLIERLTAPPFLAAAGEYRVAIDLATPGLDIAAIVRQLRALPIPPHAILAFGPHVQAVRLAEARAAGCDQVLTRGQFHAQLESILRDQPS